MGERMDGRTGGRETLAPSLSQAFEYTNSVWPAIQPLPPERLFSDTSLTETMENSNHLLFWETKLGDDLSDNRQLT